MKQETRQISALHRRKADCEKYAKMLANKAVLEFTLDGKEVSRDMVERKLRKAQQDVINLTKKLVQSGAING